MPVTATVTPYEVALLNPQLNARFFINLIVDLLYLTDMFRNFILAYEDPMTNKLVRSHKRIACKYIKFWFIIDLLSILPFDILTVSGSGDMAQAKAVKVLRLFRLMKLTRIAKQSKFFKQYQSKISRLPYFYVFMVQQVLLLLIAVHWIACLWLLMASLQCDDTCLYDRTIGAADGGLEEQTNPSTW